MKALIQQELEESQKVLNDFIQNPQNAEAIEAAAQHIIAAVKDNKKVISCGNGGSMADAIHFAEELTGRFREERDPIAALSISDPGYLSCVSNDMGYEKVFSRFVRAHGQKGDVLVGLSTSGNSINVLNAFEIARQKNMVTIALTGNNGGKLAELADVEIRVPHTGYADRIQEIHIKVIHILILIIESELFNS